MSVPSWQICSNEAGRQPNRGNRSLSVTPAGENRLKTRDHKHCWRIKDAKKIYRKVLKNRIRHDLHPMASDFLQYKPKL